MLPSTQCYFRGRHVTPGSDRKGCASKHANQSQRGQFTRRVGHLPVIVGGARMRAVSRLRSTYADVRRIGPATPARSAQSVRPRGHIARSFPQAAGRYSNRRGCRHRTGCRRNTCPRLRAAALAGILSGGLEACGLAISSIALNWARPAKLTINRPEPHSHRSPKASLVDYFGYRRTWNAAGDNLTFISSRHASSGCRGTMKDWDIHQGAPTGFFLRPRSPVQGNRPCRRTATGDSAAGRSLSADF